MVNKLKTLSLITAAAAAFGAGYVARGSDANETKARIVQELRTTADNYGRQLSSQTEREKLEGQIFADALRLAANHIRGGHGFKRVQELMPEYQRSFVAIQKSQDAETARRNSNHCGTQLLSPTGRGAMSVGIRAMVDDKKPSFMPWFEAENGYALPYGSGVLFITEVHTPQALHTAVNGHIIGREHGLYVVQPVVRSEQVRIKAYLNMLKPAGIQDRVFTFPSSCASF